MLAVIVTVANVGIIRASQSKGFFFESPCWIKRLGEKWEEETQHEREKRDRGGEIQSNATENLEQKRR